MRGENKRCVSVPECMACMASPIIMEFIIKNFTIQMGTEAPRD